MLHIPDSLFAYTTLLEKGKALMHTSQDRIHDYAHVARVETHVRTILADRPHTAADLRVLLLACWWHDAARTLTKKPSFFFMALVDDMISAHMLRNTALQLGLYTREVRRSVWILRTKSIGIGRIIARGISKQDADLAHILQDADLLDVMHIERAKTILALIPTDSRYRFGYRVCFWWWIVRKKFSFHTQVAKKESLKQRELFLHYIQDAKQYAIHESVFGKTWTEKRMQQTKVFAYHDMQT